MGLSCELDNDGDGGGDWWWIARTKDFVVLDTKRSRKCCSCGERIAVGEDVIRVDRERNAEGDIEERIHGDAVPLAPWWLCETCGGLAISLTDLEFCYDLGRGQSLKEQIAEYRGEKR